MWNWWCCLFGHDWVKTGQSKDSKGNWKDVFFFALLVGNGVIVNDKGKESLSTNE